MRFITLFFKILLIIVLVCTVVLMWLAYKPVPEQITYGMSFNTMYARELGLDWKVTYDAILNDLGVRHLRLAAPATRGRDLGEIRAHTQEPRRCLLHHEGAVLLEDLWSRQSRSSRSGRHFPYSQGVSRPTRHKVREFPRLVGWLGGGGVDHRWWVHRL